MEFCVVVIPPCCQRCKILARLWRVLPVQLDYYLAHGGVDHDERRLPLSYHNAGLARKPANEGKGNVQRRRQVINQRLWSQAENARRERCCVPQHTRAALHAHACVTRRLTCWRLPPAPLHASAPPRPEPTPWRALFFFPQKELLRERQS